MDHIRPSGAPLTPLGVEGVVDVIGLIGARAERPTVVPKCAQALDGWIATASGDARVSREKARAVSNALRAARDAVLVGIGTVLTGDPQLTVRMMPGASPMRVVLDGGCAHPTTPAC